MNLLMKSKITLSNFKWTLFIAYTLQNPHANGTLWQDANDNNAADKDIDIVKCVLIGDSMVGKTGLIVSYTTNGYPHEYVPTAFDTYSVEVHVDDRPIRLQLCDTSGQPESFYSVRSWWIEELRKSGTPQSTPLILVATKSDQRGDPLTMATRSHRVVSEKEGRVLARQIGADAYVECSALTQMNLKEVFDAAITAWLNANGSTEITPNGKSEQPLGKFIKSKLSMRKSDSTNRTSDSGRGASSTGTAYSNCMPPCPSDVTNQCADFDQDCDYDDVPGVNYWINEKPLPPTPPDDSQYNFANAKNTALLQKSKSQNCAMMPMGTFGQNGHKKPVNVGFRERIRKFLCFTKKMS